MASFASSAGASGKLKVKKVKNSPPLRWRLRLWTRPYFLKGLIAYVLSGWFTKLTKIPTIVSRLKVVVFKADGTVINYGYVNYGRIVTDDGMEFVVDAFQNLVELENMRYHGLGTSSTAEASTQAALVSELTTQYSTDNTRATGTTTEGGAQIYETVATNTVDAGATIEEFGLFSQAATGGGVMLERALTGTQTLSSGDGIQTTYDLTFNSGG